MLSISSNTFDIVEVLILFVVLHSVTLVKMILQLHVGS